jgi:hypothetical protein
MGANSTTFLFSDTDFVTGFGSVLSIGGNYYVFNTSRNGAVADIRARDTDIAMVARDANTALIKTTKKRAAEGKLTNERAE